MHSLACRGFEMARRCAKYLGFEIHGAKTGIFMGIRKDACAKSGFLKFNIRFLKNWNFHGDSKRVPEYLVLATLGLILEDFVLKLGQLHSITVNLNF